MTLRHSRQHIPPVVRTCRLDTPLSFACNSRRSTLSRSETRSATSLRYYDDSERRAAMLFAVLRQDAAVRQSRLLGFVLADCLSDRLACGAGRLARTTFAAVALSLVPFSFVCAATMATVFEQALNNGTVLVRDFIKSTQQNDVAGLYAGVNPAQLNWLEVAWMNWYSWVGNTTVRTEPIPASDEDAVLTSARTAPRNSSRPASCRSSCTRRVSSPFTCVHSARPRRNIRAPRRRQRLAPLRLLGTPLTSRSLVQVVYFGRCLPWMIIDYMGWFKQYKLQAVRRSSAHSPSTTCPDPLSFCRTRFLRRSSSGSARRRC